MRIKYSELDLVKMSTNKFRSILKGLAGGNFHSFRLFMGLRKATYYKYWIDRPGRDLVIEYLLED